MHLLIDFYRGRTLRRSIVAQNNGEGLVTATIDGPVGGKGKSGLCRRDDSLPLRRRFGAEGPQRGPRDEMALKVEGVVDGSMHAEETLDRSS